VEKRTACKRLDAYLGQGCLYVYLVGGDNKIRSADPAAEVMRLEINAQIKEVSGDECNICKHLEAKEV
jgi:hypothetical protein